jgi:hypothetical protein
MHDSIPKLFDFIEDAICASQQRFAIAREALLEEECTERKVLDQLHSLIPRVAIDYLPQIEQDFFIAS